MILQNEYMRIRFFTVIFNLIFAGLLCSTVSAKAINVDSLLKEIELISTLKTDAQSKVTITQQRTESSTKRTECTYYRRDSDEAFLLYMTAPENEKGNGYLRVGDNFWMYRKNTRTFQHVNRDENIGGTGAKGDDFESKKLTELYGAKKNNSNEDIVQEEKLGQISVYKIEISAKVKNVDYPRKIFWVRKDLPLILKEQSYSSSNTLMETAYYINYTEIKKKYFPIKMMFIDEFEQGNKTIVEISAIKTDPIPDQIFTKGYLESLNK